MAGDWIPIRLDLPEDPAVLRMADKLETRPETVVGYCVKFWSWVSRQCNAPTVTGVTLKRLGDSIALPGFPELLVDVGWLEYDDSGENPVITIPNYDRWLSESAKSRALTRKRVKKSRNASVTQVYGKCNAPSVTKTLPQNRTEQNSSQNGQSSQEKNPKRVASRPFVYPDDFEKFWAAYPRRRRVKKRAALKAFQAATKDTTPEAIQEALVAYAASDDGRDYPPEPARWLKEQRWEDDRDSWRPANNEPQYDMITGKRL